MNYVEKIKEKAIQNNGLITRKEIISLKIPPIYITRMVRKKELEKIDIGIYALTSLDNYPYDPEFNFCSRYQVPVFSYVYALNLFDFTDIIPLNFEVTVYKGYNAQNLKPNTIVHYVNKDIFDLGITEIRNAFGNLVRTYDIERTICDLIKNRKNIDVELFVKTMNNYVNYEKKDWNKLYEYAEKMHIEKELVEIFQLII
ncbi:type IV toxin-antitoxin system AbiEi family antitoxin domain-containing protein [Mycoplasma mycoides]|uniref:type IV toxin-antitoxin system AbiEi family antitoxin domain-containing protein n=1 Tax=Mycoplasma mycoides TaxID=2102 RepID=UPI002733EAE3|nr:type IV toxin-antitoxin system AbiEi family antitoxin domain-containing protein [Mycoplasma mycoides]MDP4040743.1 type IV toxin-antitoxin system AbiEi family antitoxin domain-containing protein [Mycoplasma mycoides]MDP4041618.1 type IV toxin-antitoxin system AbiEi family antitoxin domain-containing protein [Mycoplasma mycoides]MDP4042504.1 type IV toxin-antitoxin system AbiEi family antitoxin domain-containing protein [Mycoplasma mycoides]MDP4043977.1 type IV toxin-antitoxin system AbiEi fam